MKVNVKILLDNKSVCVDIDETELIESLSVLLNSQLNSTDNFYFIYNKLICETGKTILELGFIDECVVYAAKKSDNPLKRKIENQDLDNILNYGSLSKRFSAIVSDNVHEHTIWQNKGLTEVQSDLTKTMLSNPFQFEPLILQKPIEEMIHNPLIINSLFSSNPTLKEIMDRKPDQVKFFTDLSQYDWVKNVFSDASEIERLGIHYSENYKNVVDSRRCKRMSEILQKIDGLKSDESETLETPDYDVKSLNALTSSPYIHNLSDLLANDKEVSAKVLKACPYGSNLSTDDVSSIQNILPETMDNFKNALKQGNGNDSIFKYLEAHPIEVSAEVADRLAEVSGSLPESGVCVDAGDNGPVYDLFSKMDSWMTGVAVAAEDRGRETKNYEKEIEVLNEMGFSDHAANVSVLASEYGNVSRAAIRLASA